LILKSCDENYFVGGLGDRGSQITLIGLFSNVGLTVAKGAAGWYMHSASLLADAGHSMSGTYPRHSSPSIFIRVSDQNPIIHPDLLGDFVVLICWKLSRKPPSARYPYGFAKFESLGTTTVSLILIGGALGIGFHSYHILIETLSQTANTLDPGPLQTVLQNVTATAQHVPNIHLGHSHSHSHGHGAEILDPNAAWFAAIGIIAKEWLYRITKKVADEENSPVLLASAIHHRSDVYSSAVALFAILGTWWFPALPLDPIGGACFLCFDWFLCVFFLVLTLCWGLVGLLVSIVILQQGLGLFIGAFGDLTDAGISQRTHRALTHVLEPLTSPPSSSSPQTPTTPQTHSPLLAIHTLRAKRAGSLMFVDLTADVPPSLSVRETSELERKITKTLMEARREIVEVRVRFRGVGE